MPARNLVIVRRQHAADRSVNPQHGKIGARDHLDRRPLALAAKHDTSVEGAAAEHPRKDIVMILKIAIHRKGDRVSAPVIAIVPSAHREQHELLRVLHGQQLQKHLIEQRKDGRVRPDTQGQR
jgi:hypothetical protein